MFNLSHCYNRIRLQMSSKMVVQRSRAHFQVRFITISVFHEFGLLLHLGIYIYICVCVCEFQNLAQRFRISELQKQ